MDSLTPANTGYEEDEQAWLMQQAAALEAGRLSQVDQVHLSEYLYDMAARNRRDLRTRLTLLLAHIMKCHKQPTRISRSWVSTTIVQQREIKAIVSDSANLWQYANDELDKITNDALLQALVETGLTIEEIPPARFPASLALILSALFEPVEHPMLPLFKKTKKRAT